MTVSTEIQTPIHAAESWLSTVSTRSTPELLKALIEDLKFRRATAMALVRNRPALKFQAHEYEAWLQGIAAQQQLEVIVPVLRSATTALQISQRIHDMPFPPVYAQHLISMAIRRHFVDGKVAYVPRRNSSTKYWLTPTHVATAVDILRAHEGLFGPLPREVVGAAVSAPVSKRFGARAFRARVKDLTQKILDSGILTAEERMLLQHVLPNASATTGPKIWCGA